MNEILLKLISFGALIILVTVSILIFLNLLKIKYPFKNLISKYRLEIIFLISLIGTVGSILLSVYFKLAPCELCWYQRVFLFSVPIIMAVAIVKEDTKAHVYAFYLSLVGILFSTYHALIQAKIFASDPVFCSPDALVDCATPIFTYFGFVNIPMIAFSVFYLILFIAYVPNKK